MIIDTVARSAHRRHADDRQREQVRGGRGAGRTSPSCATTTCSSCRSKAASTGTLVQLTDVAARRADHATHRQPAVPQGRRAEASRLGRAGSRASQAPRGARPGARAAEVRADRTTEHRRRGAVGATKLRLSSSSTIAPVARGAGAALRQRVVVHRRDLEPQQGRRRAGSPPARGAQSQDRRGRVGRPRRRQRSDRDSEAARRRRAPTAPAPAATPAPKRDVRWGTLLLSPDGKQVAGRQFAPPTTPIAGSCSSIPRPARPRVLDHITGRGVGARIGRDKQRRPRLAARTAGASGSSPSTTAGCTSTPSTPRAARAERKQLTTGQLRDRSCRAVAGRRRRSTSSRPNSIRASGTSTR